MSIYNIATYILLDNNVGNILKSNANVSHVSISTPNNVSKALHPDSTSGTIQPQQKMQVYSATLAQCCHIDQKTVLKTVKQTTQKVVRTSFNPFPVLWVSNKSSHNEIQPITSSRDLGYYDI